MSDAKSSSQKLGRPSTRAMRGRSNSLGSSPNSPTKLSNLSPVVDEILTNIFVPPLPSVDARLSEDLARDKDAKGDDHPREETAPGRGNTKPPPTETVPDKDIPSRDKDHDAGRQYYQRVKQMAQYAIDDCQEFLELYEGVQINKPLAQKIDADSKVLLQGLTTPLAELSDYDDTDNVAAELKRWKKVIKTFVISMLGRYTEQENVGHPPHSTCSSVPDQQRYAPRNRDRRDVSPSSLNILHRDLVFFMSKLRGDLMPDIAMGIEVSNSELRDLHDFKLPQITKAVDDCRRVLKAYTSASNYDRDIAMEAQERCEDASDWTTDLLERFRMQKLHLDKNGRRREVTFLPFKPGGEVSIYQFMIQFENWSDGFLTEEVKADLLFNKYLDPSITECYTEICLLKENFEEMKKWLIKRYGSVVPIAHACVKSIMRLTKPSESDHPASLQYLRTVHKLLTNLSDLEISKGIPVPKLQSYLGSNAFLSALIETLPPYVHDDLFELLLKSGIDDIDSIEGRQHLRTIIEILKKKFMILELKVKLLPVDTSPGSTPAPTTKKYSKPAAGHNQSVVPPTFPVQPASKPPPVYTHSPPLTGGNATPLGQQRGHSEGGQQSYPRFGRWACPVYYHQGHDVNQCADFWNMGPRDRRTHCKRGACWTCLDKNRLCIGGGCSRIEEVPAELICVECAKSARPGMAPLNVLFCGLADHPKPSADELRKSVEAWIPNLSIQALGAVLRAHITFLTGFNTTMHITPPNPSRSSPQTTNPGGTIYDTSTGKPRTVTAKDTIIRTSTDTAFYAMQTLRIRNQDVLVFYDSGSNGHLVDGATAESLKLDVLNTENVPVGGLGGKITWSNYGMYSIIFGPDIDGECHELELQGLQKITNEIPDVDLTKLWHEARSIYKDPRPLPAKVGGTSVHILLGLKSTRLSPKLTFTMPSGLGIYESRFYDIYQSNVCFGGPHPIFTQAYHDAGYSVNNMEIMFSELARAYLNTPRTFLRVDVDDHGPPLELARELDLVEELTASFPLSHKSSPVPDPLLPEFSDESLSDKITDTDVTGSALTDTSPDSHDHDNDRDDMVPGGCVSFDNSLDHCDHLNCLKSQIPLSKLKGLQDELDIPDIVEYRCDSCANCPTCKLSARAKTKSLQEHFEQEVIKKSVHVDLEQERVWVDLPFIKDPVEFLTKKHGAHDNYVQALRVYHAQCSKRDEVKDQVKKAHAELVDRGYMVKITDLPEDTQMLIKSAPFNHYYPWRAVYKEESVTTPVRLVVDPTMTGLNEILAKGTNMLSKIPEILVRFRCYKYCWNTDISKLYNQLHLNPTSLPYSLFLFHDELDKKVPPDIWVMTRAWYGVSSTGNQAGVALEFLAESYQHIHPAAHSVITKNRYVDDVLSGADSQEDLLQQIQDTEDCLKHGGFSLKYVAKSGHEPPLKASCDGKTVGCLGLAWNTIDDTLSLAFNEEFFIKRLKGQKSIPDMNLNDPGVLESALSHDLMTRAGILSRVAELYDPCGWWEPIKVQMKLSLQFLNGLDWADPVPPDQRQEWIRLFDTMTQLKAIHIQRSVVPDKSPPAATFRIIAVADAAAKSCGCAIYAGVRRPDGTFSCNLILAKSKMVHATIPRNELEAIVLCAEASLIVQRALTNQIDEVRYYTDSRIALCWILNESKRLRMWAYNRVQAIHSMIKRMKDGEGTIPLYHINGLDNLADLLTKPKSINADDLKTTSEWHVGLKWMGLPSSDLPSNQVTMAPDALEEAYNQELFQEVENFHSCTTPEDRTILLTLDDDPDMDIIDVQPVPTLESNLFAKEIWFWVKFKFKELGWERAVNLLRLVLKACTIFKHARHGSPDSMCGKCYLCQRSTSYLLIEVNHLIDWMASRHLESACPQKRLAERFHKVQGVWYSKSRLEKEGPIETQDIDCTPFFDHAHIKKMLPVLPVASPAFESYLHYIHTKELPHMGVEATLKRIKERFYPVGNARAAITNFKRQCSKCRLILKETVELELAQFPLVRTIVAPPFWAVQLDIAMSFSAKPTIDSRKTFPCHALLIVCLLTSATDILVLDGLTTQAVVQAIERHAARYGVPARLFVDSGTQLEKLQDAKFQLRDLQLNTSTHRFQVTVATPKAHQQQGRVEAKIKIMRKMLTAWSKTCDQCNTLIGWETLFARIASAIDDVPIARGSASASTDLGWEIITPNRLKLGRNNYRQLDGPIKLDNCPQTQLERNRLLTCKWYEIFIDRIHLLIPPPQRKDSPQPEVGDVVLFLFTDPNFKKLWVWKLGVIEEKVSRSSYKIRYSNSDGTLRHVVRAAGQISIIVPAEQLTPDSPPWKVTNET
jgi:hypothetical protein